MTLQTTQSPLNARLKHFNIYDVIDTYKASDDIFCDNDIRIEKIKRIIQYRLDDTERRIILSYTELGNIRDTAELFKVSTTTIWKIIKSIKIKIINQL